MAAATHLLLFPVPPAIVAGNQADDGLYWPTILKVKEKVAGSGLLFVGDCKMASLENRARIADAGDYYLTPLPNTGDTAKQLDSWIDTALQKEAAGDLHSIYKPKEKEEPERIGQGYEFTRTLLVLVDDKEVTWTERVQIVQAESQLNCRKEKLEKNLQQAEEKLGRLTSSGKGRKIWRDEAELRGAIAAIEAEHGVAGLLAVALSQETTQKKMPSKPGRPGAPATAAVAV